MDSSHDSGRGFYAGPSEQITCLQPSEVAAPLLQIGTPVACWEPLAIVPRRDNIVGGLVLVVPLAICSEQQDIILRRGGNHGWSHSDNHPHGASSRRFAPR